MLKTRYKPEPDHLGLASFLVHLKGFIAHHHVWTNNLWPSKPLRCIVREPLTSALQQLRTSLDNSQNSIPNCRCCAVTYIWQSPPAHLLNTLNYDFLCFVASAVSYNHIHSGTCFSEQHKSGILANGHSRVNSYSLWGETCVLNTTGFQSQTGM